MSKPDPAVQPLHESNPVQATALPPRQPEDALKTFDALDDLLVEHGLGDHNTGAVGHALHETLFGPRDLHGELQHLAAQSNRYKRSFPGQVHAIADFAITSGHEAVSTFADRIAQYARSRRSTIPRVREELVAAKQANNAERALRLEADLEHAGVDFAKSINSAFKGWFENRAWIRRSIESEREPEAPAPMPPAIRASERKVPEVDWELHRARLIANGDTEGLDALDAYLAKPPDERGFECGILDGLNSREYYRKLRAELRPAIEADNSTPVGVCTRWKLLAEWASRFARHANGRVVMNFGFDGSSPGLLTAERMYPPRPGELSAPELAWAKAFRDSTQSLVPLVLEQDLDDIGLQTLVRDMEEVLDGKAVEVADHVREVELIVRTLLGRLSTPGDNSVQGRRGVLVAVHEVAKILVGRLKALVELVHQYRQIGVALLRLDYHLHLPPDEDPDPGEPERAARWRTAIATLKADLNKATAVWTKATASPDQWLERTLVASGKGATCGPITYPSCHELVIVLTRGLLEPRALAAFETSGPHPAAGWLARQRAIETLREGESWRRIVDDLDREFEKANGLLRLQASTGRPLAAEVRSEHEREHPARIPGAQPPTPPTSAAEAPTPPKASPPDASHACFLHDGDGWTVQFAGLKVIVKHSKGMTYLQRLLMQPGIPISATDLGGLDPDRKQSRQEVLDPDLARAMSNRLRDIDNAIEFTEKPLLEEERNDLNKERARIIKEVSEAKPLGRDRLMKSEQGRVAASVRSALNRAIATIKERHEPLWEHLESSLIHQNGATPCYQPNPSVTWMVNASPN